VNWETIAQGGAAAVIAAVLIMWVIVPSIKGFRDDLAAARVERGDMRKAYEDLAVGTIKTTAAVVALAGEHMKASADKSAQVCEGLADVVESQKAVVKSLQGIADKVNGAGNK